MQLVIDIVKSILLMSNFILNNLQLTRLDKLFLSGSLKFHNTFTYFIHSHYKSNVIANNFI